MNLRTRMEKTINGQRNLGGIIVSKNGETVYENYFHGSAKTTGFTIFSVTKSIVSLLIGIAVDQGYIKSLDQKVLEFFPDYQVPEGEHTIQKITLKDLLTMTAPYKYKSDPYVAYFESEDWVRFALDQLGGKDTIGDFRYTPIIGPDIFSGILTNVTGLSVLDFANKNLFGSLEINVNHNITFRDKEEQLRYYKQKDFSGWVADPKGINTAGWGLALTTKDMVKIGQLFLNKGTWNGKQIISQEWLTQCKTKHSWCQDFQLSYGYLWWLIDPDESIYAAVGDGGNIIYINEKKNMVVAIASFFQPHIKNRIKLIQDYIEPVF